MQFNFIFCPQTRGWKSKEKETDLPRARCPFPVLCQVLLLPAQQGNRAAASATAFGSTQRFFMSFQAFRFWLVTEQGPWMPGWKTNQPEELCMHRAGPGLSWVLGGCGAGKYPEITFSSQSVLHLSFPFNHFTLMGSKTLSAQTLTSNTALIKVLLFICTSSCDFFFLIHLLKNNFFPSSSSSSMSGLRWAADTS